MDAKELSAFLAPPKLTAREILLLFTALVIDLSLIVAGIKFYTRSHRQGILFSVLAAALAILLFRKRKFALAWSTLSWPYAFAISYLSYGLVFWRILILVGATTGLYFTARLQFKLYPYLSFKSSHAVFEGEVAMEAENARIEAEARELVKRRPFGPWLFR